MSCSKHNFDSVCIYCEKEFKDKDALFNHHQRLHLKKYSAYVCALCECHTLPFRMVEIRRHMLDFHLGYKPHDNYLLRLKQNVKNYQTFNKCPTCPWFHPNIEQLEQHIAKGNHLILVAKTQNRPEVSKRAVQNPGQYHGLPKKAKLVESVTLPSAQSHAPSQPVHDWSKPFTLSQGDAQPISVYITPISHISSTVSLRTTASVSTNTVTEDFPSTDSLTEIDVNDTEVQQILSLEATDAAEDDLMEGVAALLD